MRLDQELVKRGLSESRTEAQELIAEGLVTVGGVVITKSAKNIEDDTVVEVAGKREYVSRGGNKLHGIFQDIYGEEEAIRAAVHGKMALDIGSSTGGFTDCLLKYGASHVDAVDVGTEQFHHKLRGDPRITLYESTDIREFVSATEYDIVVADLSFISLESVFDAVVRFGKEGAQYFLLIKPQFEVGKGNTKKGIVKDLSLVGELLKKYEIQAKLHALGDVQLYPCHIRGGDGNQEYFLYAKK